MINYQIESLNQGLLIFLFASVAKSIILCYKHFNKDENVHSFALSAIRGELLERERERDPHNFEMGASMDHPIGEGLELGLTLKLDEFL